MKYINELREGNRMSGVYLCKHKQSAVTKNGNKGENNSESAHKCYDDVEMC